MITKVMVGRIPFIPSFRLTAIDEDLDVFVLYASVYRVSVCVLKKGL